MKKNKKKKEYKLDYSIFNVDKDVLNILLIDRTSSTDKKIKNIIWANNNYIHFGKNDYYAENQMTLDLIYVNGDSIIIPRSMKNKKSQKQRTDSNAEVFTPIDIVKKQNDKVDFLYVDDDLITYVERVWLEITCGEAPYMTTRYDMNSGSIIPLNKRVGFIDRKLSRINNCVQNKRLWKVLVEKSYKSSYGYEWNGDSLLLARLNLLYTYYEYYKNKWGINPSKEEFKEVAIIISYNLFQMDGLKNIIPLTEKKEEICNQQLTLNLFSDESTENTETNYRFIPGKRVKIMDWHNNKMIYFDEVVR